MGPNTFASLIQHTPVLDREFGKKKYRNGMFWKEFCRHPTEENFQPLFEQTKALVWKICFRILRNYEDACDAFQSVYCRLLALSDDTEESELREDFQTGLYRLIIREANRLRMQRDRRFQREVIVEEMPVAEDPAPPASQVVAQDEMRQRLETLVNALPSHYSLPLMLHYFHGMTHREIAASLGETSSTISNRIARGQQKLRPMMRRAGISGLLSALTAISLPGMSLTPPATLSAPFLFAKFKGGATTVQAGANAGASLASKIFGRKAASSLVAVMSAILLVGIVSFVTVRLVQSSQISAAPVQSGVLLDGRNTSAASISGQNTGAGALTGINGAAQPVMINGVPFYGSCASPAAAPKDKSQ